MEKSLTQSQIKSLDPRCTAIRQQLYNTQIEIIKASQLSIDQLEDELVELQEEYEPKLKVNFEKDVKRSDMMLDQIKAEQKQINTMLKKRIMELEQEIQTIQSTADECVIVLKSVVAQCDKK